MRKADVLRKVDQFFSEVKHLSHPYVTALTIQEETTSFHEWNKNSKSYLYLKTGFTLQATHTEGSHSVSAWKSFAIDWGYINLKTNRYHAQWFDLNHFDHALQDVTYWLYEATIQLHQEMGETPIFHLYHDGKELIHGSLTVLSDKITELHPEFSRSWTSEPLLPTYASTQDLWLKNYGYEITVTYPATETTIERMTSHDE